MFSGKKRGSQIPFNRYSRASVLKVCAKYLSHFVLTKYHLRKSHFVLNFVTFRSGDYTLTVSSRHQNPEREYGSARTAVWLTRKHLTSESDTSARFRNLLPESRTQRHSPHNSRQHSQVWLVKTVSMPWRKPSANRQPSTL